jgi:predicted DNA-binding antitoxin AbrB/MazE fold protein
VYENGVFKPLEKVEMKEGERMRIEVKEFTRKMEDIFGILKSDWDVDKIRDEWR